MPSDTAKHTAPSAVHGVGSRAGISHRRSRAIGCVSAAPANSTAVNALTAGCSVNWPVSSAPRRHPQRCDDEEDAVTGADDRGGRPQPPGSRVCVRCPHVRCRGEARQPKTPRRHPAEGTGGGSVSVDNRWRRRGVAATVPRLAAPAGSSRRAHRGPHHRRTCGPDPDPGVLAADGRRGRAAGGGLPPRRRMVGRRPRHLRRRCAQPRGRRGRGGGVGRLPAGARTPLPRRGRRCLGRNTMGGGARRRAWRRPGPACHRGRLSGRQPDGGGGATGTRRRRAADPVPAVVVPGHDVGHVAAVVHRECHAPIGGSAVKGFSRWYVGDLDLSDMPATLAPARAKDLAGLPPAYIAVAGHDPLRDDGAATPNCLPRRVCPRKCTMPRR